MGEYLHPGVYVEEVSSGVRPIEGAGTSTAGFVGITAKGIPNKAVFVTSWSQYVRKFGGLIADSYLPYAVSQFFGNGGKRAYVVRALNSTSAATATVRLPDRETSTAQNTLTVSAAGGGDWGNSLTVKVEDGTTNPTREFKLKVYYEGSVVEVFDDLTMDRSKSNYVETAINGGSEYIEVKDERLSSSYEDYANLTSTGPVDATVDLDGLTATLVMPDGHPNTVPFAGAIARDVLVTRLNTAWNPENVTVSLNDANRLVITHNASGYDKYFILDGDFTTAIPFARTFDQGEGSGAPATLKSEVRETRTITIADGGTVSFTFNSDSPITTTFNVADNGNSTDWALDAIASKLETSFRAHNSVLTARVEGNRVTVVTANKGQHSNQLAVTGNVSFTDVSGANPTATGAGGSESGFVQSAKGPFNLAQTANFYIVVNNAADATEFEGENRIRVNLGDAAVADYQAVTAEELATAINTATDGNGVVSAADHVQATVVDSRVVISQNRKGPLFGIRVVDGAGDPNIKLKFQGAMQYGFCDGDAGSPFYRPSLNLVSGVNESRQLVDGDNGSPVSNSDYIGNADEKSGLHALDDVNDVNFVAIPGQGDEQLISDAASYCSERADLFFIADSPGTVALDESQITEPARAQDFLLNRITKKTSYGALYYPWIEVSDPIGAGKDPTRFVPPSGFVAGLYARTDIKRGVHKAPAGVEASLSGALGLEYSVTDAEQDILNPYGVNCIRMFPASGIVIWGARTLSAQSDAEWRYIPVRRYSIYLRVSIYRGTQWAVFEPNDTPLWSALKLNIQDFMMGEFRKGALAGSKPDEAFFVKCDADLNPESEVAAGRVNMEVAFAPLRPAEFVIIKISQKTQRPES